MGKVKLYFSMFFATGFLIAVTTFGFLLLGELIGGVTIFMAFLIAVVFGIIQWLLAPALIRGLFKLKPAEKTEYNWLVDVTSTISKKSGIKPPKKVYVSKSSMANAFAFGNFITGKKVAVTEPLLQNLNREEISGVIAHEIGHIKNHDVEVMMLLSFLPTIFYFLSRIFFFRSYWGTSRDRGRGISILVGLLGLVLYFVTSLGLLAVSRVREHLADRNGTQQVGGKPLARALTKLHILNGRYRQTKQAPVGESNLALSFKTLFITDPEKKQTFQGINIEDAMYRLAEKEPSLGEKFKGLFSSHPLLPKRIKILLS